MLDKGGMVTNSRATTAGVSRSDRPEPTTLRGIACGLLCALGLLAGVAQAQTITTTYEYDSLGNRISATNLIRLQDTRVTSFAPKVGLPSDRVAIFGRNLPPGDGSGFTVTFNGIAAEIIAVAPMTVVVEVPQGARTGPLVVTLPNETEADLGIFHVEGVIITPGINRIVFAQTIGFVAEVVGAEDQSVTWDVMALPSPFGDDTETNP